MARSVSTIDADLATWYAARAAIATGQSYAIGGRSLTRASLKDVNSTIDQLERERSRAANVAAGGNGFTRRGQLGGMGY